MARVRGRYGQVSELQLVGVIARMFGGRNAPNSVRRLFEALDETDVCRVPFKLSSARWIADRLPIFDQMRKPSRSDLLAHLEESPNSPIIVVDAVLPGQEAVYIARLVSVMDSQVTPGMWLRAMGLKAQLIVSAHDEYLILAAPLASFVA